MRMWEMRGKRGREYIERGDIYTFFVYFENPSFDPKYSVGFFHLLSSPMSFFVLFSLFQSSVIPLKTFWLTFSIQKVQRKRMGMIKNAVSISNWISHTHCREYAYEYFTFHIAKWFPYPLPLLQTPLHEAAYCPSARCVHELVKAGAHVNVVNVSFYVRRNGEEWSRWQQAVGCKRGREWEYGEVVEREERLNCSQSFFFLYFLLISIWIFGFPWT